MIKKNNIVIQGHPGSFHDEAAQKWFKSDLNLIPADSFEELGEILLNKKADYAVMAIENSIAGTILQNYRILRENGFWILGETYLRIEMNLMACPGIKISDLKRVESHPMALNQVLDFMRNYPDITRVNSKDTALSAARIARKESRKKGVIASKHAASLYGLDILASNIETHKNNYTRFFIIGNEKEVYDTRAVNKVSAFIKIPDKKGQLLKVLQKIEDHHLNLSKLQSFPVLGSFREYFFHMDIEFDHIDQYFNLKDDILQVTSVFQELGIYARADLAEVLHQGTDKIQS